MGVGYVEARIRDKEFERRSTSDGNRVIESGVRSAGSTLVVRRWANVVMGLLGGSSKYVWAV